MMGAGLGVLTYILEAVSEAFCVAEDKAQT